MELQTALTTIAWAIGPGAAQPGFLVELSGLGESLGPRDFALNAAAGPEGGWTIRGELRPERAAQVGQPLAVTWRFTPAWGGWLVDLSLAGREALNIHKLCSLDLEYTPGPDLAGWRVPTLGLGVEEVGLPTLAEVAADRRWAEGTLLRGVFPNSREPGLLLATCLPQHHRHLYRCEAVRAGCVRISAATEWIEGPGRQPAVAAEQTWVCALLPIRAAIAAYTGHLPLLPGPANPVTGWNSWDYYFSTVSLESILENMDALEGILKPGAAIVIDMGWEHAWGEWQPNYRFPGGLEHAAQAIAARGFTPGIWTAPLMVHPLSLPGLRMGEILVKDENGDPWRSPEGGQYMVDPTHPAGQEFLREVFTRLHRAGFRFFKIDYVLALLSAPRFFDPQAGPYAALAAFFRLVRACVGAESHILGCSLPEECGPGLADSRRTGIDIHNQWTHVEWAMDSFQLAFWQNDRIATHDPDFLVVRGQATSLEVETNVLNPSAHRPNPPRWRRGPDFTLDEARTWATIVLLAGGSLFLSDRITMLNEVGLYLVKKALALPCCPTQPLDLGDGPRPALWYGQRDGLSRLGMINWGETAQDLCFSFREWGLPAPAQLVDSWSGEVVSVTTGAVRVMLPAHGSALFEW